MLNTKIIYLNLLIISASIICFEIISTRISSVIFVNNYAFIILSLAILGLGMGGIYSYYLLRSSTIEKLNLIFRLVILIGITLLVFIISISLFSITNPFIYFFLLILPFFFAGIFYSQVYKIFAEYSFVLYASDLVGAAIGSVGSILLLNYFSAPNGVLFLSLLIFASGLILLYKRIKKVKVIGSIAILILFAIILLINSNVNLLRRIPIGFYPEKDFYHVYQNAENISRIEESRWSIFGRTDLVEYTNQDVVKQLFIDGSAGSQMYRFNGDISNPGRLLSNMLINHSTSIPFAFLTENEKNSMLVIGPGGGKEIIVGLMNGIDKIKGVEINPDFVNIVKEYSDFNGGIYSNFPNVDIEVAEGRHFIKHSKQKFDIICMALPSTEQLQSIDNLASNENFLLTVEAIKNYLGKLTPEGQLILTVHNRWELIRLIVTALYAFEEYGISNQEALNHFIVLGEEYAPTIVIKKNPYSKGKISYIKNIINQIPKELPGVSYFPYNWNKLNNSRENILLKTIKFNKTSLVDYIKKDRYDISPVWDDSPFFYKVNRGVPTDYLKLLGGVLLVGLFFVFAPAYKIKWSKKQQNEKSILFLSIFIFIGLGLGFMIFEISLFQKFILYLGSPTLSLSILLGSLLVGMGIGSYLSEKIYGDQLIKKLSIVTICIVVLGLIFLVSAPIIFEYILVNNLFINSIFCFIILFPIGFLLGIPFPTALRLLRKNNLEKYIPWMYGINGLMSVLGSIISITISMMYGYSHAFMLGLILYLLIFLTTLVYLRKNK